MAASSPRPSRIAPKALLPLAAALALLAAVPVQAQAPATAAPSAAETEFWRSAERIGTPDAYRAFLSAFPNGLFAPMARAALAKGEAASPVVLPGAGGAGQGAPAAALTAGTAVLPGSPLGTLGVGGRLQPLSREAENSGIVTFRLGDWFAGPGALMVGRFGAKKQLLLPAGDWVVLAAVDSKSTQNVNYASHQMRMDRIDVGTIVFGRFAGSRLVTLLSFTMNGRQVVVPTWSDLAGCEAGGALRLRFDKGTLQRTRDECIALRSSAEPLAGPDPAQAELRGELQASLASLGAVVRGAGLTSTVSFGDRSYGYLGVSRIDWPGHWLGAPADDPRAWTPEALAVAPAQRAYVDALVAWAAAYREAAREGYWRDHPGPELSPGGRAAAGPAPAGLGEWPPGAAGR